jgi:DNA transposition AAA+ family ATPase
MVTLQDQEIEAHVERLRRDKTVALDSVQQAHTWLKRKRNARQCGRLMGDSRTGKTKTCESYLKLYGEPDLSGRVPVIPVSYVHPKQECTSRELFREILEQYGDDLPKGTVGDARSRTLKVLRACKTEMLMIDEADRLKPKTFADVRDIFDKLEIAVILIGTKQRLDPAVKKDEQVFNRFRSSYRIGTIPNSQLKTIVGLWERDIIKLPVPSNLTTEAMLKVLRKATGVSRKGYYIGLIDMVLREAAIRALEKGQNKIDLETLQEVAEEYS